MPGLPIVAGLGAGQLVASPTIKMQPPLGLLNGYVGMDASGLKG